MNIITEIDFTGNDETHPWAAQFSVLTYATGGMSLIPKNFFSTWRGLSAEGYPFSFHIGSCSGLGVGSTVKYDSAAQSLRVGRFVSGGSGLRFILNGQHEMRCISTYMFDITEAGLQRPDTPQYADSVIKNDVWLGDEVMMLGGGIIENGCVIAARALLPPNFRSEPYGIYGGAPARLIRYRFCDSVRSALLNLAWWDLPLSWIRENNALFLRDLTTDTDAALDIIAQLEESKRRHLHKAQPTPAATQAKQTQI